jgi:hypothetical protein
MKKHTEAFQADACRWCGTMRPPQGQQARIYSPVKLSVSQITKNIMVLSLQNNYITRITRYKLTAINTLSLS